MNMNHEQEPDFERRLCQLSADDAPRSEHQAALREQALAAFESALAGQVSAPVRKATGSESCPTWKRLLLFGREAMKRPVPRYVAAASVLAAMVWMLFPGPNNAAFALTKMVDAVVSARSARFQMDVNVEGQPKQTAKTMFLAPAKYRMEMTAVMDQRVVNISDFEAGKMLSLMPGQKLAVIFVLKNMPKDAAAHEKMNHFERLRRLLAEQGDKLLHERLGEKMIDGRNAVGFRLESGIGALTLWGDPKTGQPIRIENVYSGVPKTEVVMSQFEMNVDLKAELFAQDIPRGYKVQSFDVEASKPQERDFMESLKICAAMSGGAFPDALDTQSVIKLMIGTVLSGKKDGKEPDMQELMQKSIKIGRGFEFALNLPATAKAHYAGKGVKVGTKDRPIFWYLPEGSQRYRVIDATLSASDADEAPRIESAVPLAKKAVGRETK
jgi:outer membrane lipoprotein-sorting protein